MKESGRSLLGNFRLDEFTSPPPGVSVRAWSTAFSSVRHSFEISHCLPLPTAACEVSCPCVSTIIIVIPDLYCCWLSVFTFHPRNHRADRGVCTGSWPAGSVLVLCKGYYNLFRLNNIYDCLCGLVVRVPGYRSGGPGTTKVKVVGLKRGPLSLVSTTEELLGSNNSGSGLESREYGRRDFFLLFIYSLASG
jgi:hypothetical protein